MVTINFGLRRSVKSKYYYRSLVHRNIALNKPATTSTRPIFASKTQLLFYFISINISKVLSVFQVIQAFKVTGNKLKQSTDSH